MSHLFCFVGRTGVTSKENNATLGQLSASIEQIIAREGYELVDLELVSEQGRKVLRLYVDVMTGSGVSVDDCARVSHIVSDLLDVEEPVAGAYHLEVSSPGLFRPLTKPIHFEKAVGERVRVKTYQKLSDRRVFTGVLKSQSKEHVSVEVDGTEYTLPVKDIAKANLEPLLGS